MYRTIQMQFIDNNMSRHYGPFFLYANQTETQSACSTRENISSHLHKKIMSKRLIKLKSFMIQMAENFREKNKKLNNFLSFV